jgi:propane monooxygenase reductase subunit
MAPLWAILNDHLEHGDHSRPVTFFYGARTERDLFYLDKIAKIEQHLANFRFIAGLSHLENGSSWDGEQGFIHTIVDRYFKEKGLRLPEIEAYACGPPPMIDALVPVLELNGVDQEQIHLDKFTQAPASRQ